MSSASLLDYADVLCLLGKIRRWKICTLKAGLVLGQT